jgi:hypothetical protein
LASGSPLEASTGFSQRVFTKVVLPTPEHPATINVNAKPRFIFFLRSPYVKLVSTGERLGLFVGSADTLGFDIFLKRNAPGRGFQSRRNKPQANLVLVYYLGWIKGKESPKQKVLNDWKFTQNFCNVHFQHSSVDFLP